MKKTVIIISTVLVALNFSVTSYSSNLPIKKEINELPTDFIYRMSSNTKESFIEFVNLDGEIMLTYPVQEKYDISSLQNGVYTIQSVDQEGNVLTCKKFVKN